LPTTVITNLGAHYSGQAAENTINKLLSSPFAEARLLGKMAFEELFKISPNFLQNINFRHGESARNYRNEIYNLHHKVTDKYLKGLNEGNDQNEVKIVDWDKNGLLKIASQILYTSQICTNFSKRQINNYVKENKDLVPEIIKNSIPDRSNLNITEGINFKGL
jgi:hypothetical protein